MGYTIFQKKPNFVEKLYYQNKNISTIEIMLTREEVIKKVQQFTQEILSSGVPLERVILFGSYAKNKANNDSDIDVALVSTIFNGFGYEDRKHFSKINIKKQFVDIETRTFASTYFEKGDPFIAEIIQTGIELYNSKMNKILVD